VQLFDLLFRPIATCPRLSKQGNSRIVWPFAEELLIRPGTNEQIWRLVEKELSQLKQFARNVVGNRLSLDPEHQFRELILLSEARILKDSVYFDSQSSRLAARMALRIAGYVQELLGCQSLEIELVSTHLDFGLGTAVQQVGGMARRWMQEYERGVATAPILIVYDAMTHAGRVLLIGSHRGDAGRNGR